MGYFVTERDGDELCACGQRARDIEYEVFARYAEKGFWDLDLELERGRVAASLGRSPAWVEKAILAYHRLRDLPKLRALQAETRRLDITRLEAIGETVDKLYRLPEQDALEEFDELLVQMFTPTRAGQALPSPMAIRRRLNDRLRKIDASLAPDTKKKKERKDKKDHPFGSCEAEFYGLNDYDAGLSVTGDAATIGLMDMRTRLVAKEAKCSQSEAIKRLLTGELTSTTGIVLHLFASKSDRSTYYVPNFGWTDAEGTEALDAMMEERPPRIVDLEAAEQATTAAYTPTDAMKAYVQARDGGCIYPGCDRPATKCQLDHRVPFGDGGPTTPSNLFCLCQRHHNVKTDRRAFYVPDPATGEIVWLFADGTYRVVEPEGLLAESTTPERPRWRQTIAQRREQKAAVTEFNARCHAAVEKFEQDEDYHACVAELERLEKAYGLRFEYWPSKPMWMTMSEGEWKACLHRWYQEGMISAERAGIEEPVPF